VTEPLLTQREAAALLKVSERYLRASECPKVLLPGNGPKRKPIVRYRPSDIEKWSESRNTLILRRRAS
jgi:hypothetical protein